MAKSIDDIIATCKEKYNLKVTSDNERVYRDFLERQLKAHTTYDLNKKTRPASKYPYPYFNLMVSKLSLFSYLIGETPIISGYEGNTKKKKLKRVKDLILLSPSEIGESGFGSLEAKDRQRALAVRQTDKFLLSLYRSFLNNHHKYQNIWPNWNTVINQLGKDPVVQRYYGKKIISDMIKAEKGRSWHREHAPIPTS